MKRVSYKLIAHLAPFLRRGPIAFTLLVLNLGHAAIHGTALDGGMLDGIVANLDAWLLSQAQL